MLFLLAMLMAATDVMAQTDTLTCAANGVTWKFTVSGVDAAIIGSMETKSELSGALNVPETLTANETSYTVRSITGFREYKGLTSLSLPGTLTAIVGEAFRECEGMTGPLTIPDQVQMIANFAFAYAGFMGDLVIPNSVTKVGAGAFYECRGLNGKLTLSNQLKSIEMSAFAYCSFTGELDLPVSVTKIAAQAFYGCDFTSVRFPETLTEIGLNAFGFNNFAGDVVIPSSVTKIENRAFNNCDDMRSFTFAEGTKLTSVENSIWESCKLLEYIDLTKCDLSKLSATAVRGMFAGKCYHTLVYLPDDVDESIANDLTLCNFIQKGKCERFYVQDEYSYYMPYAFTAKSVVYSEYASVNAQQDTTVLRRFTGANCKTLYLPYPTPLPDGMRAYKLVKENTAGDHFLFTSLPDGSTLEAYHPYLVRIVSNTSATLTFPRLYGVSIPATPDIETTAIAATADSDWKFYGSTERISHDAAVGLNAYNLSANVWHPITTANSQGYVHPFRCFIAGNSAAPAKSFSVSLREPDGTTTAVSRIDGASIGNTGVDAVYTLDGRRATGALDTLPKGIYVVNGKKIVKP